MIRAIFIGGLTNGKVVYDYLRKNKYVELCMTFTYPDDFAGARHVIFEEDTKLIKTLSIKDYISTIKEFSPDVIFVAGWAELIPSEILSVPKMGVIGFHPAKLPNDRGRSVLAWQIEDGYTETALTMFKYTNYPDGGDILAQERIVIEDTDYISDVLDKVDEATYNIMRAYFPLFRQGLLVGKKQDLSGGNFRRLRGEKDSAINWSDSCKNIYNKIRAISKPYPGAEFLLEGKKCKIWKAEILDMFPFGKKEKSGTVVAKLYDGTFVVKAADGFIHVTEYDLI